MTYEAIDLWLAFAVGLALGGSLGIVGMSLLFMSRDEPDEHEGNHGI